MIRVGMVGLGKMGLSHHAILNTHPDARIMCACDSNSYVSGVLNRSTGLKCYGSYPEMLEREALDAVVISTPSRLHAQMVEKALERGLHVFCEKPFVLDVQDGERLVELAAEKQCVTQVGYHYRFVAAFQKAAEIVSSAALGTIHHVRAEAYGPVVLKQKGSTWRSEKSEGGGALYDYACHAVDLINYVVGVPDSVHGVILNEVFSRGVEDEVYCSLGFASGASGQLAVNWSDESFRKMSTRLTVWGSNGRLTADRQECQVYLREARAGLRAGWSQFYTTDLTAEVWFYLRGEEYSAQLDHFVQCIKVGRRDGKNSFASALETDRVVALIAEGGSRSHATHGHRARPGLLARVLRVR